MVVGALRRLLTLFAAVSGATLLVSLALGGLSGQPIRRSIALGFYIVGSILLLAGFFVGNRGVLRAELDDDAKGNFLFGFARKGVRPATDSEKRETVGVSVLVIGLGIGLLFLGVLADSEKTFA